MIIGSGILQSGGDSKFIFIMESTVTWLFAVPAVLIAAIIFNLPIYYVYFLLCMEEIIRLYFGLRRIKSKKWINNLTT